MDCVKKLIHFFYPTYCLHCNGPLQSPRHHLCLSCFEQMEWIDPTLRCPSCYGTLPCPHCHKKPKKGSHLSLFEGFGPILSLYHHFLKRGEGTPLAALLLYKWSQTLWPKPDLIVPATWRFFPKKDPSYLLCQAVARLFRLPLALPKKRFEGKRILLITSELKSFEELKQMKAMAMSCFPLELHSLSLIDSRGSSTE